MGKVKLNPDAEVVFFLGDGILDIAEIKRDFPNKAYLAVFGTCDFCRTLDNEVLDEVGSVVLSDKRIVYTHGHSYGAKFGFTGLSQLAKERRADIVLFGHTHQPTERYVSEPFAHYLFNPGSIGKGDHTFGILTLTEKEPLFSFGKI